MAGFKLDYDSMAAFDALPKDQQDAAWKELSDGEQKAVMEYHPKYVQEKQLRQSKQVIDDTVDYGQKVADAQAKGEPMPGAPPDTTDPWQKLQNKLTKVGDAVTPKDSTLKKVSDTGFDNALSTMQGVSMGLSPKMKGALETAEHFGEPLMVKTTAEDQYGEHGPHWNPRLGEMYRYYRDAAQKQQDTAHERSPYSTAATEFLGGMEAPIPGFGPAKGATKLARAVNAGAKGFGTGAVAGGVSGLSNSDAELTGDNADWRKAAFDTVMGMGAGGLLGGTIGAVAQPASELLQRFANKQAIKAVSPNAGITNRLRDMGLAKDAEQQKFGRELLNEGIVPWSGSKETALNNAENLMENKAGPVISKRLDALDRGVQAGTHRPLDYEELGYAAREGLPTANAVEQMAQGKGEALAKALEEQGNLTPGSFRGAWDAKRAAQRSLNFSDEAPEAQKIARKVEQSARSNIHDQARSADVLAKYFQLLDQGVPNKEAANMASDAAGKTAADFHRALERYGTGAKAAELAKEATGRNALKSSVGIPEALGFIAAASGGAAHSPLAGGISGVLGATAMHLARSPNVNGPLARGADAMSHIPQTELQRLAGYAVGKASPWSNFLKDDEEEQK